MVCLEDSKVCLGHPWLLLVSAWWVWDDWCWSLSTKNPTASFHHLFFLPFFHHFVFFSFFTSFLPVFHNQLDGPWPSSSHPDWPIFTDHHLLTLLLWSPTGNCEGHWALVAGWYDKSSLFLYKVIIIFNIHGWHINFRMALFIYEESFPVISISYSRYFWLCFNWKSTRRHSHHTVTSCRRWIIF